MALLTFLQVPKITSEAAFPSNEVNRTNRFPCFSATEVHISEVINCERKNTDPIYQKGVD